MSVFFIKIWQHLELTFIALFFAMLIAMPLGVYLTRIKKPAVANTILRITGMIQTIPGLALIALIIVILMFLRAISPFRQPVFFPP